MLCKLTPEEEVRMHILLKGIADDPNALEMQKFIQHGSVTTYEHLSARHPHRVLAQHPSARPRG